MHLPVNKPVKALLRSTDVLHDFAVPQFRVKMDLVPGLVTYQWFTPMVPGTYEILCEELCGAGHFAMRGKVVVDEPKPTTRRWLASQQTFAADAGASGRQRDRRCGQLRGLLRVPRSAGRGQPPAERAEAHRAQELVHPPAARATSSTRSAAPSQGDQFGMQMAPMSQTVVDPAALENVLAHIATLPDKPAHANGRGRHQARPPAVRDLPAVPWRQGRWAAGAPTRRRSRA